MDESSPILISEENGKLRIAWDNRRVRQGRSIFEGLLIPWIICVPVTLLLTAVIFVPEDLAFVWVLFLRFIWFLWGVPFILGWLFTIVIPCAWITGTWSERIEISKESFFHGKNGFLAWKPWSSKNFQLNSIIELALGSYPGSDPESSTKLNVIRQGLLPGNRRKHEFGYWLVPELRVQVFKTIRRFVQKSQIPLKITRYGPPSNKTAPNLRVAPRSKPAQVDTACAIEVVEHDRTLRLQWDNKRACKKYDDTLGYGSILAVWTSATVLVTYSIFRPDPETYMLERVFGAVWCTGAWSFMLVLTHLLAQRFCTEWIEVSGEFFSHRRGGLFFRQPKTLALDSVDEFGISQSSSKRQYAYRLNVSYDVRGRGQSRSIGDWMEPEARKQVFQIIEDFVARKQIPLRMAKYGP